MAWIFALLVLINTCFWGWEYFFNSTPTNHGPVSTPDTPPLTVIQGSTQPNTAAVPSMIPENPAGNLFICYLIGPLHPAEVSVYQKMMHHADAATTMNIYGRE